MDRPRRTPEELLKSIQEDEIKKTQGQLKIFFGYAAGVGKTYAMLKAAHMAKKRGVDVVLGYVEPHARPKTQALMNGLESLPTKTVAHKGMLLHEFDLDAALARKPQLILVDELAHTNAESCRHSKRYQDVKELLIAGIDVYTTVNVQHIESLNDMVASITGVTVRERIPDEVFDRAGQVELVDIEPSDLIERLNAGEVYREQQARRAVDNFFTVQNLTALREIALRRCADRVNLITESAARPGTAHADEHILVCLSSSPSNAKIIRTAARMAAAFHGRFTALFVETPDFEVMEEKNKKRLRSNIRLAQQLGATIETAYGDDIAYQISEFARLSGVSKIVLGRSAATRKWFFRKATLTDQLIARTPSLDVYVIPDSQTNYRYRPKRKRPSLMSFSLRDLLRSVGILFGATALSLVFYELGFSDANIIMSYILGVLMTSIVTTHRSYSIVSAIASVIIYNFLFTVPRFSLQSYEPGSPVTFAIMFLTAYITGTLAVRLKSHAKQAAQAAYRTKILFDADQMLNRAQGQREIVAALADQMVKLMRRDVVIYLAEGGRLGEPAVFPAEEEADERNLTGDNERTVAQWVMKNNKHAGATTETLSGAQCLYLAIRVNQNVYGVVGIAVKDDPLDSYESSVLLSILGEGALALENEKNAREKEAATILAKNEQLRANLLRAISHDLRTPLTSISGNASNLISNSASFDEETKQQLYTDIYDDSMWLINLVENLLSVTRIEEGRMNLHLSAELMDEVIAEALHYLNRKSTEHEITVSSADEFILAQMDAKLIVQVIINIVDNAIKYTPPGSHIRIATEKVGSEVKVRISDDGPGISDEAKARVFDMFYCGTTRVADSRRSLGLGLSLCKSIISAHGGTLSVSDNVPHGTIFQFTLPAEEVHLHE